MVVLLLFTVLTVVDVIFGTHWIYILCVQFILSSVKVAELPPLGKELLTRLMVRSNLSLVMRKTVL